MCDNKFILDNNFMMNNLKIANEMATDFVIKYYGNENIIEETKKMRSMLLESMKHYNRNELWLEWRKMVRKILKKVGDQIGELKTIKDNLVFPMNLISQQSCTSWSITELAYLNNVLVMVNVNKTAIDDILTELYCARNNIVAMIDNSTKIKTKRVKSAAWVDNLLDDGYVVVHKRDHGRGIKSVFISDCI